MHSRPRRHCKDPRDWPAGDCRSGRRRRSGGAGPGVSCSARCSGRAVSRDTDIDTFGRRDEASHVWQGFASFSLELHLIPNEAGDKCQTLQTAGGSTGESQGTQPTYSAAVCESSDFCDMLSVRFLVRATGASALSLETDGRDAGGEFIVAREKGDVRVEGQAAGAASSRDDGSERAIDARESPSLRVRSQRSSQGWDDGRQTQVHSM